jgi:hypothetical protein
MTYHYNRHHFILIYFKQLYDLKKKDEEDTTKYKKKALNVPFLLIQTRIYP